MPWLLLLIPMAAAGYAIKKNRDAAAAAAAPPAPAPLDAATIAAAQAGVPAAVAAVQAQLAAQIAAGQGDQPQIEFPANSPEQDAQNAAMATAQQNAQQAQTVAQADAQLQAALGNPNGGQLGNVGAGGAPIGLPPPRADALPPGASALGGFTIGPVTKPSASKAPAMKAAVLQPKPKPALQMQKPVSKAFTPFRP